MKEGWLQKEGGAAKSKWQNRWFVLHDRTLCWYLRNEDKAPQGSVSMSDVQDVSVVGEHSNKPFCLSLVSAKKVYYLAAETEVVIRQWCTALETQWLRKAAQPGLRLVKYATAEVFLTQGVRIAGDVNYGIFSVISSRVPPEKKRRDALGWFCDRPITVATILNLFSEYGWTPERIYRSMAPAGSENSLQPVIRVIFSKSPPGGSGRQGSLESSTSVLRSGAFNMVTVSDRLVGFELPPGASTLEGTDDELIDLMQEFGIPLSLLLVPSTTDH